jgi:hypothetical protein
MTETRTTDKPNPFTQNTVLWLYGLANVIRRFGMNVDADQLEQHAEAIAALLP